MFDLEQVFQVISDNNLKISVIKCEVFKDSLSFLGFQILADGVRPLDDKVEAIRVLVLQIKCGTYVDTWACSIFLGT